MPNPAHNSEIHVATPVFSLKNAAIISTTNNGYVNKMVDAIPASISLKLRNKNNDDNAKNNPIAIDIKNSLRLIRSPSTFIISNIPMSKTANEYL